MVTMGHDRDAGDRRSTTSRGSRKDESPHDIELCLASTSGEGGRDLVADAAEADAGAERVVGYRTYRRRWFGLVQLTLLNIIVSWDVSRSFFFPEVGI